MGSPNHEQQRIDVLNAAREGRATYLPAGARDNSTAQVFIDGQLIGQASTLMHFVREDPTPSLVVEAACCPGPAGCCHVAAKRNPSPSGIH